MSNSIIYAFDFDGVICDSTVETAMTGWKAAGQIWNDMSGQVPQTLVEQFREVRPIIETGYEAILAMRLLFLGESSAAIYHSYGEKTHQLLEQADVSIDDLKKIFGDTRDQWIASDLAEWIQMNPLYPGLAAKLQKFTKTNTWYVITTKQERFVKQILTANAIEFTDERIFGMDRNMTKAEVLQVLIKIHATQPMRFIEDRLPALLNVQKWPELAEVELMFALWGYNTTEDKTLAAQAGFTALNLDSFFTVIS